MPPLFGMAIRESEMSIKRGVDRSRRETSGKGHGPDSPHEQTLVDDPNRDILSLGAASVAGGTAGSARAEEQFRAREAFYRNLIEGAADVTTLIAPDGTILYASASISEPT